MTDIALDEELAPCPFCGGTVKLGNENIFVCTGCGANISLYSEDIVSEWNRRASPSQVAPQPANPAQVTDATDEAVRLAGDILMSHGLNAPEQVIYRAAREILETAAIGAGGQAVAWRISCPDDEIYGRGPDTVRFHPLSPDEIASGYTQQPLSALSQPHPADERVVEALERLRDATPQSTNTVSADGAFAYVHAVAATALEVLVREGR